MTGITIVIFCHIRTCNDGCNTSKQIKVDLILIHLITPVSIAPVTEYLNKHGNCFVYTMLICNKPKKAFLYKLSKEGDNRIKIRYFNFS